ncbi:MAG TPA: DUF4157 domain-containing protein [Thermoanaerobaculia bacterium]|nr:DUF4157 domain-containing protein [Thermoanaerobaculia bacterium]
MKTRPPKGPKQPSALSAGTPASGAKTGAAPGNRTLALLLASGRVRVSQPGDPQERQADRIADAVTSPPAPVPEEERTDLPSIPTSSTLSGVGPGRPLDPAARAMLEPRFGRDLGAVRVHEGPEAAEAAQAAEARAFTVGRDVVFSPGQYAPGTPDGRHLLAHELAHVVQQSEPESTPAVQRSPWDVNPPQPAAPAAAPAPAPTAGAQLPTILEIGATDVISSQDPRLAEFAKTVQAALTPASTVYVTGFWDANTATKEGGLQRSDAEQRAKLAKAALSALGIPAKNIATGVMDRNLLSEPSGSPAGLVRIAFHAMGFQLPQVAPGPRQPVPPPRIPLSPPPIPGPPPRRPSTPPATSTPPTGPPKEVKPRKGEPGDVAKAVLALSPVKKALDEAKEKALKDFKALPPEGKIGLITGAVAIAAGAAAGLATHPDVAKDLLEKADGLEIPLPLPGVPGEFKVQILNKPELPKFDPHAPTVPDKLSQPAGQGAMLKWEIRF